MNLSMIVELNWNAFETLEDKIEYLSSCAYVVHTTAKQVISRRRKNENVFKMSKDEKCTCKACKNTVFNCQICKFVGFLLPSSSWLLKLPNKRTARAARTYEQVRAILCKTTTPNYLIYSFDDNLSIKAQISNSLYLI